MSHSKFSFAPVIFWFLLVTFLLCLPGSEFPKVTWLSKIWFDKWVHVFLFFVFVLLWCRAWKDAGMRGSPPGPAFLWIAVITLAYGIGMELIQHFFVPFRSFEFGDVLADGIGSFGGYWLSARRYIKK